jgi:hypothetical protein
MGTAKSSRPPKLAFLIMPIIFTIQTWTNHILKYNKFFLWNTPHQIVGWITVCFRIAFLYKYMYIYMYIYIYLAGETSPFWVNSRLGIRSVKTFHPRYVSSEVLDPQTGWIWWSAQRAPSYRSGGSWAPRAEDEQVKLGGELGGEFYGMVAISTILIHFAFFFRECHLDVLRASGLIMHFPF